ncbi:MAG: rRNA maturation RNase YbeY [Rhodocyclaceae bacterium]
MSRKQASATALKQSSATLGGQARVYAVDRSGRAVPVKAEWLEIDFGSDGRMSICLSGEGGIEVIAEADGREPALNVVPGAANAVTLRLEAGTAARVPDLAEGWGESAPAALLKLTIQKAVSDADKTATPKKHQIRRWAQAALRAGMADVTVRLVGEEEGRVLNRDFRGKDYATNVLTFVYDENETVAAPAAVLSGDLVVCVPVVLREAHEQGKPVEAHFAHLVVHGMLHLQGYDHEDAAEAVIMEGLEAEILATLGFPDPYA